uniref:Branched-chain amino acid transport system ATP-binding protein n=1 Tax=Candidatus Kentrum sp. TUN TaxID=2126343 RepID=A0A450Z9H2_9GAMM|nr:MAG: branched-chain amino acid transport system ATP-binding protein [Candidatus Kentron sp. TUN]VFK51673.1 MAG: branched-chain amino acid transport system ATP-binding protein [Candidatus Kentron sp. TUN]
MNTMNAQNASPLLAVRGLGKAFGGITASHDVDLDVYSGEIHAIIGPNGAGKTTLISLLAGTLKPDSGEIRFAGRDITRLPVWRRARLGFARSFQIISIFAHMSVLENVALAVQVRAGHSFRFWARVDRNRTIRDRAMEVLARTALAERVHDPASSLSHGELRQLEIALVLAMRPRLLLLDEPMAGMSREESDIMIDLIRHLKSNRAILLIEHDMDAVFALADRISVLVHGRIVDTGTPERIRNSEAVQRAYLGDSKC